MPADLPKYVTRDTDRHGSVRYYYRRNGRKTRLRGEPTDPEFLAPALLGKELQLSKPPKITSFVYFVLYGNRIKIGTCANVKARMRGLRTGIPGRASVYYVTPGGRMLESKLHDLFSEDRVSGEWFMFSTGIKDWIMADEERRAVERQWLRHERRTENAKI